MREYINESELWRYYDKEQRRGVLKAFSARREQSRKKLRELRIIKGPYE